MNEPHKTTNSCCARSTFLWVVFASVWAGAAACAGAAAVNHRDVITVWAPAPTTCRWLIRLWLCGTGIPHGTCPGGCAAGWVHFGGWVLGFPVGMELGSGYRWRASKGTSLAGAGAMSSMRQGAAALRLLMCSRQEFVF